MRQRIATGQGHEVELVRDITLKFWRGVSCATFMRRGKKFVLLPDAS